MVLSFPLAADNFADLVRVHRVNWHLRHFEEMSGAGSGEWLTAKLMPDLWEADVQSVAMKHSEAYRLRGRLAALGSSETVMLYNPMQKWPQADPGGTIHGASTPVVASVNADRKRLAISGLPANYIITEADLIAIDYDTAARRALVQALETITANGAGATAQFEVRPILRAAIAGGDSVKLLKPAAKVKIVPASARVEMIGATLARVSFMAVQTLEAN